MANEGKTKKSGSKKGTKQWRKNVDIKDVEEALDKERKEELQGGALNARPNDSIFFVDKGASKPKTDKKTKPLKIDLILQPNKYVKSYPNRLAPIKRDKTSIKEMKQIEKLTEVVKNAEPVIGKKRKLPETRPVYDLWGSEKKVVTKEQSPEPSKKKQAVMKREPKPQPAVIPAVKVTHPGASYQPSKDAHEDLIKKLAEDELKRQQKEKNMRRRAAVPATSKIKHERLVLESIVRDLQDHEGDDEESEEDDDEKEKDDNEENEKENDGQDKKEQQPTKKNETPLRKTKQQRKKEMRRKKQELLAKKKKLKKVINLEYERVRFIGKQMDEEKKKREETKKEKLEKKMTEPEIKRLGKLKFKKYREVYKLSSDIPKSLRELAAEGNLFKDRFKSLQERNIIETRVPQNKRRRYRLKVTDLRK